MSTAITATDAERIQAAATRRTYDHGPEITEVAGGAQYRRSGKITAPCWFHTKRTQRRIEAEKRHIMAKNKENTGAQNAIVPADKCQLQRQPDESEKAHRARAAYCKLEPS